MLEQNGKFGPINSLHLMVGHYVRLKISEEYNTNIEATYLFSYRLDFHLGELSVGYIITKGVETEPSKDVKTQKKANSTQ